MGHDGSHANGGGQVAVAFTLYGSDGTARTASETEIAGSARTRAPGSIENSSTTAVLQNRMAVRRLTPRECERLQGFPDDYTLVEYRGKLAADGPRYKALGNSMAVPVMHWIGQRIAAVDAILRDRLGVARLP
jgi:DNA (cytosine-5)-methyltransferase 1